MKFDTLPETCRVQSSRRIQPVSWTSAAKLPPLADLAANSWPQPDLPAPPPVEYRQAMAISAFAVAVLSAEPFVDNLRQSFDVVAKLGWQRQQCA